MKEPSFAYDQEKGAFCRGGRCEVKKRCDRANIVLSMNTIRRHAREMRDQERAAADAPPGEASGVDLSSNIKGKCGAKVKYRLYRGGVASLYPHYH